MKPIGAMISTLPEAHVLVRHDAAHAAPVIAVVVGIDHGGDRQTLAHMLLKQLPCRPHRFGGRQHVEQDPARLAAHEGGLRQVEPAHLIDAGDDFVEAEVLVQLRDAVHRRVDRVELLGLIHKGEPAQVPGVVTGIGLDDHVIAPGDQTPVELVEIAGIAERHRLARRLQDRHGMFGRGFALGVEVARRKRRGGLRGCRSGFGHECTSDGERGTRRRNRAQKISSRGHIRLSQNVCPRGGLLCYRRSRLFLEARLPPWYSRYARPRGGGLDPAQGRCRLLPGALPLQTNGIVLSLSIHCWMGTTIESSKEKALEHSSQETNRASSNLAVQFGLMVWTAPSQRHSYGPCRA